MPWIIDKDHIAEPDARPGTNCNAIGVIGPRSYKGDGSELSHHFRMLDDDRTLYYEGRSHDDSSFDPIDHFGEPNAGCTIIQYKVEGKWRDL